jgi:4-hydroxy-tetrahydrodipicolinate synthase
MKLEGSFVAIVTPFTAAGDVDAPALRALIRRQLKAGTSGLVPCGTTGEAATLSHEEQRRVVQITLEECLGRAPVFAGVASNDTAKAVALCKEVEAWGADGILLLAPYYTKPTQEGLYLHFKTAARATNLPVMIYNIPGRTAVNMTPATILRLARDCKNVVAVKEAAGSLDQVSEITAGAPSGFTVLSGDDSLTLPMMAVGAKGVVSVLANVAPKPVAELCRAALKGDHKKARALHAKYFHLTKSLFLETNPIPVKAALGMMGLCRESLRLPMTPLSPEPRAKLKAALKAAGLL